MLRGKGWLAISAALLVVYAIYVIWAKLATVIGTIPVRLSETAEFLLFFSAVVAFALQVFVEDALRGKAGDARADHNA
jgi:hypothetical protein